MTDEYHAVLPPLPPKQAKLLGDPKNSGVMYFPQKQEGINKQSARWPTSLEDWKSRYHSGTYDFVTLWGDGGGGGAAAMADNQIIKVRQISITLRRQRGDGQRRIRYVSPFSLLFWFLFGVKVQVT